MTRQVVFGTGQVGRHVVAHLVDLGHDVVAVNRSGRGLFAGPLKEGLAWSAVSALGADAVMIRDADVLEPTQRVLDASASSGGSGGNVLGSRVLGSSEGDDAMRQTGVHVFAALVRVLTGVRVTDTSSGLRAMLAEVPATVPLNQPQYQSSELLLGAIFAGYKLAERPVVMHKRTAGVSKKGGNVLYGARYARVILRTWWRARRLPGARVRPARVVGDRPRDVIDDEAVHPGGQ